MPTRPRLIGVFIGELEDAYQRELWRGIEGRARERGVGVVSFLGRRIASPVVSEAAGNIAYSIADSRTLSGLVVVSSAIATFLSPARLASILSQWSGLPRVSVGLKVQGMRSVTVDGADGVGELVRHLVRDHGCRRIALLGGPARHPEARERARGVRAALAECGIELDSKLVTRGNFTRQSGLAAARRLLRRGARFDALVCLNDRMALGAMEALRGAGLRVPEDVAIVGFDGIEEGRYVTPPLTTVSQPLLELGRSAVDVICELLERGRSEDRVLAATAIIRQSCGCPPRREALSPDRALLGASVHERKTVRGLLALARRGQTDAYLARLNAALAEATLRGESPWRWNDYLAYLKAHLGSAGRAAAELLESSLQLIGEAESRVQAARRMAAEQRLTRLRSIGASLASTFDMPTMLARLAKGLRRLGIRGAYLALFDPQDSSVSRLLLAPGGALPARGIRFETHSLLPARVGTSWRREAWVLEPLVFETVPLGFLLLPGGATEPAVYETLREQVASALKGALLLEQVLSHERRLEQEVARRTAQVTRTNQELTREIERRMRLEKEVTEISNRTMQRIGQDLHDDLCQHLAGVAMLTSALRAELAATAPQAAAAIGEISDLLEDSIRRAKQIARGLYPAALQEHGLAAAVEELVEAARRSHPAEIEFRASPGFRSPDTDQALQVYRIIQEALTNSLKHSGSPRIEVRLHEENGRLQGEHRGVRVAEVIDYGKGMPQEVPEGGMGLRIMRYRAEMAGAELRIERLDPGTRVSCRFVPRQER